MHRRLELTFVRFEGVELCVDRGRDVLDVVGLIRLPQQQRRWPVMGDAVLRKEVGIPSRDDSVAHEETSGAVVGMQAVPLPRVVAQDHLGPQLADHLGDRADGLPVGTELTVDPSEEADVSGPITGQTSSRFPLLVLTANNEPREIGGDVPRAF